MILPRSAGEQFCIAGGRDRPIAATRSSDRLLAGVCLQVGIGAPLSGNGSDLGREMVQGVTLAIDELNDRDGLFGARVEAVALDDGGDENRGVGVAQAFANSEVLAVVGHYNSNVTLRAAPIYHQARLPLVGPIVSNPKLTESGWDNVFRFTNRDDATAGAIARYLIRSLGKRRAAVVATRTTYGASMSEAFAAAFANTGGTVTMRHAIDEGTKDFGALLAALPTQTDVIFYGGTFEGAPLLKAMRGCGLPQLFATGDGCWDQVNFLRPAGAAALEGEGVLVLSACPQLGIVTGSLEFATRYTSRFGPIVNYAVNAYDAGCVTLDALRRAAHARHARPEREDVLTALRQTDFQGIAYPGPVKWDEQGDNISAVTALHVVREQQFLQIEMVEKGHRDCV